MSVIQVKSMTEFRTKIETNRTVIVDFFANWCGPCRTIAPSIEKLALEHTDIVFLKVDVDELEDVAQENNIQAMPTFKAFGKGVQVGEEVVGANLPGIVNLIQILSSI